MTRGRHLYSELLVTAIVTAKHQRGFTVFVPTAPVPTSGIVYHVPAESVQLMPDVSVEQAMKTVIACGAGSQSLLQQTPPEAANSKNGSAHSSQALEV